MTTEFIYQSWNRYQKPYVHYTNYGASCTEIDIFRASYANGLPNMTETNMANCTFSFSFFNLIFKIKNPDGVRFYDQSKLSAAYEARAYDRRRPLEDGSIFFLRPHCHFELEDPHYNGGINFKTSIPNRAESVPSLHSGTNANFLESSYYPKKKSSRVSEDDTILTGW